MNLIFLSLSLQMARQLAALCKSTIQRYTEDKDIERVTQLPYPLLHQITNNMRHTVYKRLYRETNILECKEIICYDEARLRRQYVDIILRPYWHPHKTMYQRKTTKDTIDEDLDFRMLTYWQFHHLMQQNPYTNTPWLKDEKNHIHIDYTTEINYRYDTNRKLCILCSKELRHTNSNDNEIQYYGHTDHRILNNVDMLHYYYTSEHWCQRCGYRALFNVYTYEDCCWIRDYHRKNSSKQEFQRRKRKYNAPTDTSEDSDATLYDGTEPTGSSTYDRTDNTDNIEDHSNEEYPNTTLDLYDHVHRIKRLKKNSH